ncbi:unnamed protein product [Calicophoron daubneyi]|uniref:Very-long-chain (3R)-3-hydroxyacyl-CoA dehydratase n=1 Tax=Calicophoron daubneyi TaxID=300641 RepID=A0AAV2TP24_CALDB
MTFGFLDMNAESLDVHPFVHWGQDERHVFLSVKLGDAQNVEVNIGDEELGFYALGNGAQGRMPYRFRIAYYLPVVSKESRYAITGRAVVIKLRKELKESWPRLTKFPNRFPWLRVDFDLYQFDASDLEESDTDNTAPNEKNVELKIVQPSKEERRLHNEEMKALEDEEEWEAFIKILKHPLTIYLLFFNVFQLAGFIYVFGMTVLNYLRDGAVIPTEAYESIVSRLIVVQLMAVLEPLHALLGWVRGGFVASVLQVFGRNLVLFFILIPHEELHSSSSAFWLLFAWSTIELVRYPYYILSLLGFKNAFLTYLRFTLWIPLYPLGFVCEGKLIVRALPLLTKSRRFSVPMPNPANMSFDFPLFLHCYLIFMMGGIYYLMKHMYARRRRVIGPRPRVGAEQMGFFSFIPYLRSLVGAPPSAVKSALPAGRRRFGQVPGPKKSPLPTAVN